MACYNTTKPEPVNLCVTIGVTNTRESPLFAIKHMYECRPKFSSLQNHFNKLHLHTSDKIFNRSIPKKIT